MKKHNIFKRITSFFLMLALLFGATPLTAIAEGVGGVENSSNTGSGTNLDNIILNYDDLNNGTLTPGTSSDSNLPEYSPDDALVGDAIITEDGYRIQMNADGESYSILEYLGVSQNVKIPESYKGIPITKILDAAFYGNTKAESIIIPESIVFIGEYTFYGLSESFFYNTYNGGKYIGSPENPYYYFVAPISNSATEITLHEDTVIVGSYAFENCENMKTVTIGNNVISMGYAVFGKCSTIANITIPFIGENGKSAKNAHFGYIFGARTTGGNISYIPSGLKKVSVLGGDFIARNAMYGVDMIEDLTLPFLGSSIDDTENNYLSYVFGGASYDDNIIPQTLKNVSVLGGEIGYGAFYECVCIKSIVLKNCDKIGDYAFRNCTNLEKIEISDTINHISSTALYGCSKIQYNQYDNAYYIGNSNNPYLVLMRLTSQDQTSCTINSQTRVINDYAFANSYINTFGVFNIPSSVRYIGESAFYNCGFYYVNLPQNLQSIGSSAFENCKYLKYVYIYKNVSELGSRAFYGCTELSEVYFEEGSALAKIDDYTFAQCKALNFLPIPEGVTSVGSYAFARNSYNSATVTFPSTLKYVGQSVFGSSDYSSRVTIRYNGSENDWYQNVFKATNHGLNSTTINFLIDNSEYSGFLFATNGDGTCYVRGYQGTVPSVLVIPDVSNMGESVVSIGYEAFANNKNIVDVILPNSVNTIGSWSFAKCTNLLRVTSLGTVTNIQECAFAYCSSLNSINISYDCVIGADVFYSCNNLLKEYDNAYYIGSDENPFFVLLKAKSTAITSCEIHPDTKKICENAFSNCTALLDIEITKNVEYIGARAFYQCSSLTTIELPFVGQRRNENSFLGYIFGATSNTTADTYVPGSLKNIIVTDSNIIEQYAFYGCKTVENITFSKTVTYIGKYAFYNCNNLLGFSISEGISKIEEYTWGYCSKLASLKIPNSVVSIGNGAFSGCKELSELVLPSGITEIARIAFFDCDKLETVTIPASIKVIGDGAFENCDSLKNVLFEDGASIENLSPLAFSLSNSIIYNEYDNVKYLGSVDNPYLVLIKSNDANRTSCTIHSDTRFIVSGAFESHANLESIHISKHIKKIAADTFRSCYKLTSVTFDTNSELESIGANAFYDCSSLVSVILPSSIKEIGDSAFCSCDNLKEFICKDNSELETIGEYAFASCYKLNNVALPNSVKEICTGAFSYCNNLIEFTIPAGVVCINSQMFANCSKLVKIVYDGELNEWRHIKKSSDWDSSLSEYQLVFSKENSSLLFESSEDISEFYLSGYNGEDGNATVPPMYSGRPVTVVYEKAFDNSEVIRSITLPDSIISIQKHAFRNCHYLKKINLPESVVLIESGILSGCVNLEELTVPFLGATIDFEENEFAGYYFGAKNYKENRTYVPETLRKLTVVYAERISDYCFFGCAGLVEFTIPDSVVSVGEMIFNGCNNLAKITIGASLQNIADYTAGNPLFGINKSGSVLSEYAVSPENEKFAVDEYGILYRAMNVPYASGDKRIMVEVVDVPAMSNLSGYAIPDHIVAIGAYAFAYNSTIRMIDLEYVRKIGNHAFYLAGGLINVTLGTPTIADMEFEAAILETVYSQYIDESAFMGCASLQKIDIGSDNIVGIGDYAFADCPMLRTIMLGKSVEKIGLSAFGQTAGGDSNVERFVVDKDNAHYRSIDGVLYSINFDKSLTLEIFPAAAIMLDDNEQPVYINGETQYLTEYRIPSRLYVKAIQSYAFRGAKYISNLYVEPSDELIVGDYAFAYSNIKNVTLGENVTSLGLIRGEGEYSVFADMDYLTFITVSEENEYYSSEDGVLFDKNQRTLIKYPAAKIGAKYIVPNTVEIIASMAFKRNVEIENVIVESYISTIGFEAFYACKNLKNVKFIEVYAPLTIMENAFTTFVEITEDDVNPKTAIGYSLGYYYSGALGEVGWVSYANVYSLFDNDSGAVTEPPETVDKNNFYAIVVVDGDGNVLENMIVSLTDPTGKIETVRSSSAGVATFYDLAGDVGFGFSLDFLNSYVIRVADQRGRYFTYESSAVYLDEEMRITYITLERKPCDVSFNANGGDGIIETFDIEVDGIYEIPAEQITKSGYTLLGFSDSPDGAVKYTTHFSTSKYKAHYVLYAIWEANTNKVIFDANGGTGSMDYAYVKTDSTITLPENLFARMGYTFMGWATSENGAVVYTNCAQFTSGVLSSYTLYARWLGNENAIVFNAGGADGEMTERKAVTDTVFTLPDSEFTRAGYTFSHWIDESGIEYLPGASYTVTAASVQVFTAVWLANINTVRFNSNGGTGSMDVVTEKTDSVITLPAIKFVRVGYMPLGWSTSPNGAIAYDNAGSYTVTHESDVTLYVVWAELPETYGDSLNGKNINTEEGEVNIGQYYYKDGVLTDDDFVIISTVIYENYMGYRPTVSPGGGSVGGGIRDEEIVTGLYQNGHRIAEGQLVYTDNGSYRIDFLVHVEKLIPDIGIEFISVYADAVGSPAVSLNVLKINVFDFVITPEKILSSVISSKIDLSAGGSVFVEFFGAEELKFDVDSKSWDIDIKIDNSVITIDFVGKKENVQSHSGIKDVQDKKHSIDVVLGGKVVLKYDPADDFLFKMVSSSITGVVKYNFSLYNQYFIPTPIMVIPVAIEIEGSIGAGVSIDFVIVKGSLDFDKIIINLMAEVEASAGVGFKAASGGVYGKIGTELKIVLLPIVYVNSWEIEADVGAYIKIGWFKYKISILNLKGYIISPQEQKELGALLDYSVSELYFTDNYDTVSAEDLANVFEFVVIDGELYKLGYIDASERVGYDENNFIKLTLSKWNGDGWDDAVILDDNGMNDSSYTLYSDGEDVYAVVTGQTRKLSAEELSDTYASSKGMGIKVINLRTGEVTRVTDGTRSGLAYITEFAVVDGVPTLVWAENADYNIFGVSPDNYIDKNGESHTFATSANSILVSRFTNGEWSTPELICGGLSTVSDIAVQKDGKIAYIIDTNANLADTFDRVMFYGNIGGEITAFNHTSVGSITNVEFTEDGLVYYYDVLADNAEEMDGLRILSGDFGYTEKLPTGIPENHKLVTDADGNVIAIFYFANKTWIVGEENATGSALYAFFKENGAWSEAVEITAYEAVGDRYIYSYDVTVIPEREGELMISVSTFDNEGSDFELGEYNYKLSGMLVITDYNVNYADGEITFTVYNGGAVSSAVYVSTGGDYVLLNSCLSSGASEKYTLSLSGGEDNRYTLSVRTGLESDTVSSVDNLDLNYSDIQPYAKQLLLGNKNVVLLAVKNNGNTPDTAITVVRAGSYTDSEIISDEILNAISTLALPVGECVWVELDGEKFIVVKDKVDARAIAYHEIKVSDFEREDIGIISIASMTSSGLEKSDMDANNYEFVSYEDFADTVSGEEVTYKPEIFEPMVEFDKEKDESAKLNYTYGIDDYVTKVTVDSIELSQNDYTNSINGTRGMLTLYHSFLSTLLGGEHIVTLEFSSGESCETVIKVVSYYTVIWKDGTNVIATETVKEGSYPKVLEALTKDSTKTHVYTFLGWDNNSDGVTDDITAISGDTTYKAVFESALRKYQITWVLLSDSGEKRVIESYSYGLSPEYLGTVFTPEGMVFIGWDKEISSVSEDTVYTAQYKSERLMGDVNGDGVVNTRDVALLRQYVVEKIELSEEDLKYCNVYEDYNEDGSVKINTRDVALLQQYVVGIVE